MLPQEDDTHLVIPLHEQEMVAGPQKAEYVIRPLLHPLKKNTAGETVGQLVALYVISFKPVTMYLGLPVKPLGHATNSELNGYCGVNVTVTVASAWALVAVATM